MEIMVCLLLSELQP